MTKEYIGDKIYKNIKQDDDISEFVEETTEFWEDILSKSELSESPDKDGIKYTRELAFYGTLIAPFSPGGSRAEYLGGCVENALSGYELINIDKLIIDEIAKAGRDSLNQAVLNDFNKMIEHFESK